jgi:hypothetical protein
MRERTGACHPVQNLTTNPDENTPMNYELVHSWVLYKVIGAIAAFGGSAAVA